MEDIVNIILEKQRVKNLDTLGNWDLFADHRQHIKRLIQSQENVGNKRICILGAGNCNDLDLEYLAHSFKEIHLVDIDKGALINGVWKQRVNHFPNIYIHGDIDLSGIYSYLEEWRYQRPDHKTITDCIRKANRFDGLRFDQNFDVVVSTCLLTQLMQSIITTRIDWKNELKLIFAIRNRHLRLLVQLLSDNGRCIFVTDLVSSDTVPILSSVNESNLFDLMLDLISNHNFFTGVNPFIIEQILREDPRIETLEFIYPWLWRISSSRIYVVYAFTMTKRSFLKNACVDTACL